MINSASFITEINRFYIEEFTVAENIKMAYAKKNGNLLTLLEIYKVRFKEYYNVVAKNLPLFYKHVLALTLADISETPIIIHDNPFFFLTLEEKIKLLVYYRNLKFKNKIVIITCNNEDLFDDLITQEFKFSIFLNKRNIFLGNPLVFINEIKTNLLRDEKNVKKLNDVNLLKYVLSHTCNKSETQEEFKNRIMLLQSNQPDSNFSILNPNKLLFDKQKMSYTQRMILICTKMATMFFKHVNIFVWIISLILPEIIMIFVSYLSDNDQFYNDTEIQFKTRRGFYYFPKGKVSLSNVEFREIMEYLDNLKENSEFGNKEMQLKIVQVLRFLLNYISSKFLTVFLLRYFFISQFPYGSYLLKNSIMNRNNHCTFLNTDDAIVISIISRIPNIIVEFITNFIVIKKMFYMETTIAVKFFLIHTILSTAFVLYNLHLLRHTVCNLGLIFYKIILFLFIYAAYKMHKEFSLFFSQIFLYHMFSEIGREIVVVLSLFCLSILVMKLGLFSN
ncbi:ABC-type polar amino acid transport system ATPase component [Ecytonucleospora hepatopenaei]|uniref:ABC-type polar amino acid transport system ATPase component n=1 Tax=Ecytonucleospora hepatopenaei TaxID=646526 RepID=A0A1W0E3U6_9MICR|nr:ABC-type polar amino acid transport system ATPase component [Ecytonucleospora hepatopenaei]